MSDAHTNFKDVLDQTESPSDWTNNQIPEPKWHDIKMGFDETARSTGRVLASFVVTELDF
jgi:hypothetical protein